MSRIDVFDEVLNPLDSVEDVMNAHNWTFERMNEEEMSVVVKGKFCDYSLVFVWQPDMNAMQFCCEYDLNIPSENMEKAAASMMHINSNLWLGHFDLPLKIAKPSFRHTCLFRGLNQNSGVDYIEDLVDIALMQCERHYSVFQLLSADNQADTQSLSLALMESAGES